MHVRPSQSKARGSGALILRWTARIVLAISVILLAWVIGHRTIGSGWLSLQLGAESWEHLGRAPIA